MEHKNLILSITSGLGSVATFFGAYATKSNIAWILGVIGMLYSIYCSYLTHMEKKRNELRDAREAVEWSNYLERLKNGNASYQEGERFFNQQNKEK